LRPTDDLDPPGKSEATSKEDLGVDLAFGVEEEGVETPLFDPVDFPAPDTEGRFWTTSFSFPLSFFVNVGFFSSSDLSVFSTFGGGGGGGGIEIVVDFEISGLGSSEEVGGGGWSFLLTIGFSFAWEIGGWDGGIRMVVAIEVEGWDSSLSSGRDGDASRAVG